MSIEEKIIKVLAREFPAYYGVEANFSIIMSLVPPTADEDLIRTVIQASIKSEKLALSENWASGYRKFFERHPEYLDCEANRLHFERVLKGRTAEYWRLESLLQQTNVRASLATNSIGLEQLEAESERSRLIEENVAALRPQIDARGRKVVFRSRSHGTPYAEEVQRIEKLSLEELRAMAQERAEKRRIAGLSPEEIHKELSQETTAPLPPQFVSLPPTYIPPGKTEGVRWSHRLFRLLPPGEQRRLLQKYGNEQLTIAFETGRMRTAQ
jgi:hypothetical protein